jgi:hypothetical protein
MPESRPSAANRITETVSPHTDSDCSEAGCILCYLV